MGDRLYGTVLGPLIYPLLVITLDSLFRVLPGVPGTL